MTSQFFTPKLASMTAIIGLEDVRFHAPHGFYEEEHLLGNEFSIDVEVEANIAGAATQDDLGGTVNYSTIYYLLQAEMKKPTQLLEALAYRMASRIQKQFDQVSSVRLRLRKLNPPLGGQVGAAVVEVRLGGGGVLPAAASGMAQMGGGKIVFDDDDDDDEAYEEESGGNAFYGFGASDNSFGQQHNYEEEDFDDEDWDDDEEDEGDWDDDDDGF